MANSSFIEKIIPSVVIFIAYDRKGKIVRKWHGFLINKKGHIITTRHLLIGQEEVKIQTFTGELFPVRSILYENLDDNIVLLKTDIQKEKISPLKMVWNPHEIDEEITIIVNPANSKRSIIKVKLNYWDEDKEDKDFDFVQIKTNSSLDISGAPVINKKGEVIGMATFHIIDGKKMSFLIPSSIIKNFNIKGETEFESWEMKKEKDWDNTAEGLYFKGLIFKYVKNYEMALTYLKKSVEIKPDFWKSYFEIGGINIDLSLFEEAIKAFEKVIHINPENALAYYNLGVIYGNIGKNEEAIEMSKKAISIDPKLPQAYYNLGVLNTQMRKFEEAIKAFKKTIELDDKYFDAYYNLGVIYCAFKRGKEALEVLEKALKIKNVVDIKHIYSFLGLANRYERNYKEAIKYFKKHISIYPEDKESYFFLGEMYFFTMQFDDAIDAFEKAISLKEDYFEAYCFLGLTFGILGLDEKAIEAFKKAIEINPNSYEAYGGLASIYHKLGDSEEAIKYCNKALEINPSSGTIHETLALAYIDIGDRNSAWEEYEILKKLNPEYANEILDLLNEP